MFESHKLSEVTAALPCGLFSHAQDHAALRRSVRSAEPAPRMRSQPRDPGRALRRVAQRGGSPWSPGTPQFRVRLGSQCVRRTCRLGKRTRRQRSPLSRRRGGVASVRRKGPAWGFVTRVVGEVMGFSPLCIKRRQRKRFHFPWISVYTAEGSRSDLTAFLLRPFGRF